MNEQQFHNLEFSTIGKNCVLEGKFKFHGDTILNCHIAGTINMTDNAKLTLERLSNIEGEIYCHDLEVFGVINGTINASGKLIVRSSASISGFINAAQLSIYPGAEINMEAHTEEVSNQ